MKHFTLLPAIIYYFLVFQCKKGMNIAEKEKRKFQMKNIMSGKGECLKMTNMIIVYITILMSSVDKAEIETYKNGNAKHKKIENNLYYKCNKFLQHNYT